MARRRFLCEFPIGSYVKLSPAVAAILVGDLKCRTQFWKGAKLKIEKGGMKFKKSSLKLQSQSQPNFAEMILGWLPSKNVFGISDLRPRWPPQPNLI
jgi:hypothetical protein